MDAQTVISVDSLLPPDMAGKAETIGVAKANMPLPKMLALSVLAGAFIGLGAMFSTTTTAGLAAGGVPYGLVRLVAGVTFSLGLMLVIVGGAELFTGNNLIVMAWADGKVSTQLVLKNWLLVYVGNFVGALATAVFMFLSTQYTFGSGAIGAQALSTAASKATLDPVAALVLGIMCNALVCLAVWLCFSARSTTDKLLSIVMPISAFVAAGLEHSIANMYFIPLGLFIKDFSPASFWSTIGKTAADYPALAWGNFFLNNLIPVTLGNIIGGAVMVGLVYWFIYLRPLQAAKRA